MIDFVERNIVWCEWTISIYNRSIKGFSPEKVHRPARTIRDLESVHFFLTVKKKIQGK